MSSGEIVGIVALVVVYVSTGFFMCMFGFGLGTRWICKKVPSGTLLSLLQRFRQREFDGTKKYGKTLDRTDLSHDEWLNHLQEELMDAALYIERLRAAQTGGSAEGGE